MAISWQSRLARLQTQCCSQTQLFMSRNRDPLQRPQHPHPTLPSVAASRQDVIKT